MALAQLQSVRGPGLCSHFRDKLAHLDRASWRRFLFSLLALTVALFLALYATGLRESGYYIPAALLAGLSLALAAWVAVKALPYLARRTAIERWTMKVEYELTREGVVYLAVVAVITVAALNTGNNLLFVILSCLLAGILASGFLSAFMLAGLEPELTLPERAFAGRPTPTSLRLANRKNFLASFSLTASAPAPPLQRLPQALAAPCSAILHHPVYIPYIPRQSWVDRKLILTFPRRGRYFQEGLRISTKFPFGFLRKTHTVPLRRELLVLPSVEPTEEFYEILPVIGSDTASYQKGLGHDLYVIRDFQPTDTGRHVDWKATAKAQQLKVREFTREDERRVGLVFDPSLPDTSSQTLDKFEKAITYCARLAWHFYEIDAMLQFVTEGFATAMEPAGEIIYPVLERLALLEPSLGKAGSARDFLADTLLGKPGFQIVLTCRPRGSIPTRLWSSSYFVFMDSL